MPNLYDFQKEDYSTLLAANVLDASKGALFSATGLTPDPTNRTILIGLGGTGIRTIDYVKGVISKRLNPQWRSYVAFLGIDASWSEIDGASYLERGECIKLTQDGVANRMGSEATYPAATRSFMPEGAELGALSSDGSGRTRLVGKVKIHDQAPGDLGNDEKIVSRLSTLKSSVLAPLSPIGPGTYQVYVIGSVCGGTCSGTILELPALIREAIPNQVEVNAMLYLPDTLESLDPVNASQLYANGYATLKELNYYMGMYMRSGYPESWSYNSLANPKLTHQSSIVREGFIDVPYLIGTTNGAAVDASERAMETIAEFLISLLAKISVPAGGVFLSSAFSSNARAAAKVGLRLYQPGTNNQRELPREFHEFPKRFSAIGFAEASVPKKMVRAYTVGCVCKMAGLAPVSMDERKKMEAAGAHGALMPFRSEEDLLNAVEGTQKARELLKPVADILNIIHSGDFSIEGDLNQQNITWNNIRDGHYENENFRRLTDNKIQEKTSAGTMDTLRKKIKEAYHAFRKNVQEYVKAEGPYAFVNLYNGRFIPVSDDYGMGIGRMLQNLVDGKTLDGRPYNGWAGVENAKTQLNTIRQAIADTNMGLLGIMGIQTSRREDQVAQWKEAYNNWAKAQIDEKRREVALGSHGALHDSFQMVAAKLTQEIEAFGRILEILSGVYQHHGEKLQTPDAFRNAKDNRTEVNIAAVNNISYQWLKDQADLTLQAVNAHNLRDNLVDHFFGIGEDGTPNSQKWLDIPKNSIRQSASGRIDLTNHDVAIPARHIFDQLMAEEFPATLDVSIQNMFVQMSRSGESYDHTAYAIMSQLADYSLPQFNGHIPADAYFRYIMYPNALNLDPQVGPAIAQAIENAAQTIFPGIQVYASDDADSIKFYQQATPMEIYRLNGLKDWERHYEQGANGLRNSSAFLHGKSPDITVVKTPGAADRYVEYMPWKDYPSIAPQEGDPTKPDPITGEISREGQIRLELQNLMEKARKVGVLYSEKTPGGWIVKRVHCNREITWQFDIMNCDADPVTGLLPIGKALAETVASQNDRTLDQISRIVKLELAGVMSDPHETEALAWEYAARTLRAHVPMYIEVRETTEKFTQWAELILKHNREMMRQFLPAKMIYMLKAQILRRSDEGVWQLAMADGKIKNVANLSPAMMKFMAPKDKALINNGLLGYYLYGKLSAALNHSEDAFDEACTRAKNVLEQLANDGDIEALSAGEELAQIVLSEVEPLRDKGARLDGNDDVQPAAKFVTAMANVIGKDKVQDVDLFYFRVGLWEVI